jgi:hypothetical protein
LFKYAPTAAMQAESMFAFLYWLLASSVQFFLRFLAEITSGDSPFSPRVALVCFLKTGWDHLDDRF